MSQPSLRNPPSDKTARRPLNEDERAELESFRLWSQKIALVCQEASRGNLEARLLGCEVTGHVGDIAVSLNRVLDVTDAFVRCAKAAIQAAGEGRFRKILPRGLPGTYRQTANVINATNELMKNQSLEIVVQHERERKAAAELSSKVEAILDVARAAAKGDLTHEIPVRGSDAIGQLGEGLETFFKDMRKNIVRISDNAQKLGTASQELSAVSQQMSANAEETSAQANTVSAASEQVSSNVQTVATGTEEMSASIREIARNAADAARVARDAVTIASTTNAAVAKLGESSNEIGKVIRVITSIAQQTKLLALNATIEAARAGEAGKGFAVVANEVKELAKETAKATEDISQKIEAIQSDTRDAVTAIGRIGTIINQINDIQTTIAGAVEEQTATTNEMSRNVTEGAKGTNEIARNIVGVAKAAHDTSDGASKSLAAAKELWCMATELQSLVANYRVIA